MSARDALDAPGLQPEAVEFAGFRLDLEAEQLWKAGRQLAVRRKPFAILRYLAANPHRLVTHAELIERVWNGVVVSESAMRSHLHELRRILDEGVIETVIGRGYRFAAEVRDEARSSAVTAQRMVVGRDRELAALQAALALARKGERQICFVVGDPGIGKTTLVDAFLEDCASDVLILRGASIEQHGTPEAYAPVIEMLAGLQHNPHRDRALAVVKKLAPTFVAEAVTPRRDVKPLGELVDAFETLANQGPVVIVHEDLHWSDVATLDLIATLASRRGHARLCVIGTSRRAEAQTSTNPFNRVLRSLVAKNAASTTELDQIGEAEVIRYVAMRFPKHELPPAFTRAVATITGGTPLFMVSLLDDLARREMIVTRDGVTRLAIAIDELAAYRPDSVRQLVDMQVDRLTRDEQRVLEAAAVIGQDFSTALVAAALELRVEDVDDWCDGLARRQQFLRREPLVEWPDGDVHTSYGFRHALVQEVCAARSSVVRRQLWHRRIATRLETAYANDPRPVAHVLALHFDLGQAAVDAIKSYLLAAEHNEARFAAADALHQARRASELLARVPGGPERDALELDVLGHAVQDGFRVLRPMANPLEMFERMVALARATNDRARVARALANLNYRVATFAHYRRALDSLDEIVELQPLPPEVASLVGLTRAVALVWTGQLAAAVPLLRELIETTTSFDPRSPGVLGPTNRTAMLRSYLGHALWAGSDPARGVAEVARVRELANATGDPFLLGAARTHVGRYKMFCGESPAEVAQLAGSVLDMPDAAPWHVHAGSLAAWAKAELGELDDAEITRLLADFETRLTTSPQGATNLGHMLVMMLRAVGRDVEALAIVERSLAFGREHEELLFESVLLRIRGELLEPTRPMEARDAYLAAIASASAHAAHAYVVPAATRLARLMHDEESDARLVAALAQMVPTAATPEVIAARALIAARTR